jgi:glyceraldehyde 3-phosphate dehydrogenase
MGINGFGRIGKLAFRAALDNPRVNMVAINDPFIKDLEYLKYLLKYDSVHGKLTNDIKVDGNKLVVDGHEIQVFHELDPANIPWGSLGVTVVGECSGAFLT